MREAPAISANGAASAWRSMRSAIAAAAADGDFSAVNEKSGIKTKIPGRIGLSSKFPCSMRQTKEE